MNVDSGVVAAADWCCLFAMQVVEGESILGTKKRRIIMLSDMLLCVSFIKG